MITRTYVGLLIKRRAKPLSLGPSQPGPPRWVVARRSRGTHLESLQNPRPIPCASIESGTSPSRTSVLRSIVVLVVSVSGHQVGAVAKMIQLKVHHPQSCAHSPSDPQTNTLTLPQSMLNVIDNSGAAVAECINVLKMNRAAKVGTSSPIRPPKPPSPQSNNPLTPLKATA